MHIKTITSKLLGLCLLTIALLAQPLMAVEILDAASGVLTGEVPTAGTQNVFSNVTSAAINLAYSGKVLVMSAYSMHYDDTAVNSRTGSWKLSDGVNQDSLPISRYLSDFYDSGIGMSVGLFDYTANETVTYALQHATTSTGNKVIRTTNASIVAIPMVSQNGLTLNSSQATQEEVTTSSTTFSQVAGGTISLGDHGGDVFLAAAFTTNTADKDKVGYSGQWQLQLETSTDDWTNVGNVSQRAMTGTTDTGAAMLMGTYDGGDLVGGDYAYRLIAKSTADGKGVVTTNATVTAMGFSFNEEDIELPHWQASATSDTTTSTTLEPVTGTETVISPVVEGKLFLGASFTGDVDGAGSISPALYNLEVDTFESETLQRTIAAEGDFAAGGAVTLTSSLAPDEYTASLQHATSASGGTLDTLNPNLVIFSTASVPEPATMGLLTLGGIAMLRRRKR